MNRVPAQCDRNRVYMSRVFWRSCATCAAAFQYSRVPLLKLPWRSFAVSSLPLNVCSTRLVDVGFFSPIEQHHTSEEAGVVDVGFFSPIEEPERAKPIVQTDSAGTRVEYQLNPAVRAIGLDALESLHTLASDTRPRWAPSKGPGGGAK